MYHANIQIYYLNRILLPRSARGRRMLKLRRSHPTRRLVSPSHLEEANHPELQGVKIFMQLAKNYHLCRDSLPG